MHIIPSESARSVGWPCGASNVVPFPARAAPPSHRSAEPDPTGVVIIEIWGICPWSDQLSDYDRLNINLYARLLHDESENISEDDLARGVFGLDPYRNRSRVLAILRSHLRRAHWLADTLFPLLDW